MKALNEFHRNKDFLICIDSDGCAMDTMDIKHIKCFGPCMVREWKLEKWEDEILTRWNEINLYTITRGINRFLGLATALSEIDKGYCRIDGIKDFDEWTKSAKELSNDSVGKMAEKTRKDIFKKAFLWSTEVNRAIDELPESDKRPFEGVNEALEEASKIADIAVISSANREAVLEEWSRCGLISFVDVVCCQDVGSKAFCILKLKELGYANRHIMMVGDAVGDMRAAEENAICFYPILVRHEKSSWDELKNSAIAKFTAQYYDEYELAKKEEFKKNLGVVSI